MEITIAYDVARFEEKALFNEARKLSVPVNMLHVDSLYFGLDADSFRAYKNNNVVLQRCISHARGLHVSAIFDSADVPTINSHEVSARCTDKAITTLLLAKSGVPTPRTILAFSIEQALEALDQLGYPAVIKPLSGSWGRLITRVRDREEASSLLESRSSNYNPNNNIFYLQEYVKRPPRDIRAIIVGDEIVATVYRYQPPDDWRTNVARGGISREAKLSVEEVEILFKAARAVGGGILGIDAMESPDGLLVHEVNCRVEFKGASQVSRSNIPQKMIEYALKVAKR